jgi:RNA polymerase sigma-70 factor, ECF subfamily
MEKYIARLNLVGPGAHAYNPRKMAGAGHDHVGLLSDEALLHNIAHSCEDCFDLLFLRFRRPVLNLACKIIRDRPEAEDVVQEVFLAIHEQCERFDPSIGSARTWILQFGYYKSLKRRRYLSKRQFYDKHLCSDDNHGDPLLVQPEFIQRGVECKELVEQGLSTLTTAQRRVVEQLHFEGHTLREISEMEGKELPGIRNSYYRGINALRSFLGVGVRRSGEKAKGSARKEPYEIEL